jgi:hypothetical protein
MNHGSTRVHKLTVGTAECNAALILRGFSRFSQNCEQRLLGSPYLFVRPSARFEELGSHWADCYEI